MELTGNLKKQVEQTSTKEEAKKVIEGAGMLLTDEELEQVSGGVDSDFGEGFDHNPGRIALIATDYHNDKIK